LPKNTEIIGTVSLLKKSDTVFELGKMAVTENVQGLGIGKLLVEHCLTVEKEKNMEKLVLYSNTKLA
jgi:N-acetylglutamate synthase-like GNAT family acetyltransferase